jgi:hypothetical protein
VFQHKTLKAFQVLKRKTRKSCQKNHKDIFLGWILNQVRNEYYYFDPEEQAYVYQFGEKIYLPSTAEEASKAADQ